MTARDLAATVRGFMLAGEGPEEEGAALEALAALERQAADAQLYPNEVDLIADRDSWQARAVRAEEALRQIVEAREPGESVRDALDALAQAAKGWAEDNPYERAEKRARPALGALVRAEHALRAIAEGGLGDEPWFANYERIREFAREALAAAGADTLSEADIVDEAAKNGEYDLPEADTL